MKRPLFLIGITYFISTFSATFDFTFSATVAFVFCSILVIYACVKQDMEALKISIIIITSSVIAFTAFFISHNAKYEESIKYQNSDHSISGRLCENIERSSDKYMYVIEVDHIDETETKNFKVRLSSAEPIDINIFDQIECKAHFYNIPNDTSAFSTAGYYSSKGINLSGFIYEYEYLYISEPSEKPLEFYPMYLRNFLVKTLSENLPTKYSSLLSAVLFGEKRLLDPQVESDFRTIGVSHILSVSGLHVNILSQFIFIFLSFFGIRKRTRAIFSILIVLCFMAITGFKGSITRAGVMTIIYFIGVIVKRDSDALNSLGIAILLILLFNPLAGGDIGLILSSLSTLGIIVFSPGISKYLSDKTVNIDIPTKLKQFITTSISTTVSATCFTLIPIIIVFKEFSLVSIPANLLIVFPTTIMVICTVIFLLLNFIPLLTFVAKPALLIAGLISKYIIECSSFLASIPLAGINVSMEYISVWILLTVLIISLIVMTKTPRKYIKTTAIMSFLILLVGTLGYSITESQKSSINILDTKNGCGIALTNKGRSAVLLSGGSKSSGNKMNRLISQYSYKGCDYLLVPQVNNATSRYSADIINKNNPSVVAINRSTKLDDKLSRAVSTYSNINTYKDNVAVNLWGNVKINSEYSDKKTFIQVDMNSKSFFISPMGGRIPNNMCKHYDFAILGKIPDNISDLSCTCTVLSMDEEESNKAVPILANICDNFILTSTNGDLKIECETNGEINLRTATSY